jgi:hypothetical protein
LGAHLAGGFGALSSAFASWRQRIFQQANQGQPLSSPIFRSLSLSFWRCFFLYSRSYVKLSCWCLTLTSGKQALVCSTGCILLRGGTSLDRLASSQTSNVSWAFVCDPAFQLPGSNRALAIAVTVEDKIYDLGWKNNLRIIFSTNMPEQRSASNTHHIQAADLTYSHSSRYYQWPKLNSNVLQRLRERNSRFVILCYYFWNSFKSYVRSS